MHSDIILNNLENIIKFVIRDIDEVSSELVVETVIESIVEVEAEAVVEEEAEMGFDQSSIIPQVSEYTKRRGIHVHIRTHVAVTELMKIRRLCLSSARKKV